MKKISPDVRARIIHLLQSGMSAHKVAQQVGVGTMTVSRIRKEALSDISMPARGRPRVLSVHDKAWLIRQLTSGKADTAIQLKNQLENNAGVVASGNTVRRALKHAVSVLQAW